jgi:hypothetical protein
MNPEKVPTWHEVKGKRESRLREIEDAIGSWLDVSDDLKQELLKRSEDLLIRHDSPNVVRGKTQRAAYGLTLGTRHWIIKNDDLKLLEQLAPAAMAVITYLSVPNAQAAVMAGGLAFSALTIGNKLRTKGIELDAADFHVLMTLKKLGPSDTTRIAEALSGLHIYGTDATISVNTRMHDLGNVEKYTLSGKRVRGGGYWGITSEDARDIAAWIGYAEQLGYTRVVLVGHSAGWASVGRYQADSSDRRVAGLVFASGEVVGNLQGSADPNWVRQAQKLTDEGNGEDLLRIPNRSLPSFISAATELDTIHRPREYADFFGTNAESADSSSQLSAPRLFRHERRYWRRQGTPSS